MRIRTSMPIHIRCCWTRCSPKFFMSSVFAQPDAISAIVVVAAKRNETGRAATRLRQDFYRRHESRSASERRHIDEARSSARSTNEAIIPGHITLPRQRRHFLHSSRVISGRIGHMIPRLFRSRIRVTRTGRRNRRASPSAFSKPPLTVVRIDDVKLSG